MAKFRGTHHDDSRAGTTGDDVFRLFQGGDDTATGDDGNDTFDMRAALSAGDQLDGGSGADKVLLNGDYSVGLTFGAFTITNVETLRLDGAFDYNLTTNDGNVAAHERLLVDAQRIDSGHHLIFDGSAETDGRFLFLDSAGDDVVTGGSRNDIFDLQRGGGDTAYGGSGGDQFIFGSTLGASDAVYGGNGDDTIFVDGDYAAAVILTIASVEAIRFAAGHVYNFVLQDGAIEGNNSLEVDGTALTSFSDGLSFDASALTHGSVAFTATGGNDALKGGAGSDYFDLTTNPGGKDFVSGGDGDDYFAIGSGLRANDRIDGGSGSGNAMQIEGDYSAGVTFTGNTIKNVASIAIVDDFVSSYSYKFISNDGNVAAGAVLGVYGFQIPGSASLYWDGSAETDGSFELRGGAGNDTLIGGAGADIIGGGTGNNTMRGGGGADEIFTQVDTDTIAFTGASDSTGANGHDIVHGFDASLDKFDLPSAPSAFAGTFSGNVSASTFDTDMGVFFSDNIHGNDAWIVHASGGDLIGHDFLSIDTDNDGFYDAGTDFVIDITGYAGTLTSGNFI